MKKTILIVATVLLMFILPVFVLAHQPRIISDIDTTILNPEISQAFYGTLNGEPHTFRISASEPFILYVNLLAPDVPFHKKDLMAGIIKNNNLDNPIAILDGTSFVWERFWEEFGYSSYWRGPEYTAEVEGGEYEIRVWSSNNDSKYSLAIGKIEAFDFKETINTLKVIPKLKKDFFEESPANFIFSPIGFGYVFLMFLIAFIVGSILRALSSKFSDSLPQTNKRNIGTANRIIRALLGLLILIFAINTTWSPIALFFSGFLFFQAILGYRLIYVTTKRGA